MIRTFALSLVAVAGMASAQIVVFPTVNLDGGQQVPSNTTPATGTASVSLDTSSGTLSWTLSHSGLLAPQTAAHFHNAAFGVNGGVVVNIGAGSPISGTMVLTPLLQAQILLGRFYINVHSTMFPGGEIRGQVIPPATTTSTGAGCQGLTLATNSAPVLGNLAFSLDVSGAAPSAGVSLFGAFGIAAVPFPLGGGCNLYLDLTSTLTLINAGLSPLGPVTATPAGSASFPFPIPLDFGLAGVTLDVQAAAVSLGLTTSNAVSITFGF